MLNAELGNHFTLTVFFSFAPLIHKNLFRSFGSLLRLPCKLNFHNVRVVCFRDDVEVNRWVQFTQCVGLQSVAAFVAPRRAAGGRCFRSLAWAAVCVFSWPFGVKDEDVCHPDR